MQQVIVDFGQFNVFGRPIGLRIYGYGLMLVLGFLAAVGLARWRARRFGEDPETVTSLGLLALAGGVVGARLAFVIERWDSQFAHLPDPLAEVVNITSGGLIYYGGLALAAVLVVVFLRVRRLPIRRYVDIVAPSLMVGLAFGRVGCFLNGCCYGGRCSEHFPLAVRFPYAARPLVTVREGKNIFGGASVSPAYQHYAAASPGGAGPAVPQWLVREDALGAPVLKMPAELTAEEALRAEALRSPPLQPAQVYAAVNAFLLAGLLLAFSRLRRREGQTFAVLLILYPVTRFVLESIRGDNAHDVLHLALTHNQYTSMGLLTVGVGIWLVLRWMPASAGPFWRERAAGAAPRARAVGRTRKGRR